MKIKSSKKIIAFLLCFVITFFSICVPAKADSWFEDRLNDYKAMKEFSQWTLYDVFDYLHLGTFGLIPEPSQAVKDAFGSYYDQEVSTANNTTVSNVTNEMRLEFLDNNITINDDDTISIGNNLGTAIKNWQNYIINDSGYYYVYSTPLIYKVNDFSDGTQYNAVRQFLNANPNAIIRMTTNNSYGENGLLTLLYDDNLGLIETAIFPQWNSYAGEGYDLDDWEERNLSFYSYNNGSFSLSNSNVNQVGWANFYRLDVEENININAFSGCAITKDQKSLIMFKNIQALKNYSIGNAPYYINESVYNDWSTSSGDYTIGSNNSNEATYNQITNWNINYEQEKGNWPTPDEIQRFIQDPSGTSGGGSGGQGGTGGSGGSATSSATANNEGINITINNNHNFSIGGSSLSGNTVSGNGSGSSGGIGGIFDWLSNLGDVVGNFIKNAGNALVSLVEGLTEVVTSTITGVTNVLNPIITEGFEGMPSELTGILLLGLAAGITISIIKILRG